MSDYNQQMVNKTRRQLGIGKKQNLFTRASVAMFPRQKAANALRRGRQAYLDFTRSGLYPDFVIKFCEGVVLKHVASKCPNSNVVNLAAVRGKLPDISPVRRKPRH